VLAICRLASLTVACGGIKILELQDEPRALHPKCALAHAQRPMHLIPGQLYQTLPAAPEPPCLPLPAAAAACANHNFGWRQACHKCGKPKPEDAPTVGSDGSVPSVAAPGSAVVGGGQGGPWREGRRGGGDPAAGRWRSCPPCCPAPAGKPQGRQLQLRGTSHPPGSLCASASVLAMARSDPSPTSAPACQAWEVVAISTW
jgi:hypothetical protein